MEPLIETSQGNLKLCTNGQAFSMSWMWCKIETLLSSRSTMILVETLCFNVFWVTARSLSMSSGKRPMSAGSAIDTMWSILKSIRRESSPISSTLNWCSSQAWWTKSRTPTSYRSLTMSTRKQDQKWSSTRPEWFLWKTHMIPICQTSLLVSLGKVRDPRKTMPWTKRLKFQLNLTFLTINKA